MSSYLALRHSRSINRLSSQRPRPSMLTSTPADSTASINIGEVNCEPWSVLEINGAWRPTRNAASQASTQKAASIVLLNRHPSTYRLHQSITATKYINPVAIGTYVMSEHQTWSGPVTSKSLNRYGYIWWPG